MWTRHRPDPTTCQGPGLPVGKRQLEQVKASAIDVELRASSWSAPRGHARPSHHPGPGLQGPGERAWALLRPTEGLRAPLAQQGLWLEDCQGQPF